MGVSKQTVLDDFREITDSLKIYLAYQKAGGMGTVPLLGETLKFLEDKCQPVKLTLEGVRSELGDCRRCKLAQTRKNIVFGEGNPQAKLVLIGEAPGNDEDIEGRPFVGEAGKLLDRIIESIDLKREDVYIANIIKCRPSQNRNPESDEIAACEPFLIKQLEAIKPKIICALGAVAAQTLLKTRETISRLRGRFHNLPGVKVMPTYHPAFLLRSPGKKREVWEDMKMIQKEYNNL